MSTQNKITAGKLRVLKAKSGFNQSKMADIMNVSQSMYSKIERGVSPIQEDQIIRLNEMFGLEIDYFSQPPENTSGYKPPGTDFNSVQDNRASYVSSKIEMLIEMQHRYEKRIDDLIKKTLSDGRVNENLTEIIMTLSKGTVSKKAGGKAS